MALRFSRLDRTAIRQMKPGDQITEHGITAERLSDGDVRFSVNVMVDGQRIHRVIGTESAGVGRTQCEEFIEQAKSDARAGRLSLPKGRKLALTMSAASDDYIKRLEEGTGKNVKIKRRHLEQHLKPFFGSSRLDQITTFTVDRYKKRRLDGGAKNATVNRELATLSHLFSMALRWKWIDRLPCRPDKLGEDPGRIIALTNAQCDALLGAAVQSADPYAFLFIAFGFNTAMRHSEILATRFDQLDLEHRRLFIPDAKAGQRVQPITVELVDILRRERDMRETCGRSADADCKLEKPENCIVHGRAAWLFPSPHADSAAGHRARMDRSFRDAVKAASLDPKLVTPHVMRHTAITHLAQAGVDLPTVQKISGHKTLAMVLRYSHVHSTHIDQAIAAIGRALPAEAQKPFSFDRNQMAGPAPASTPRGGSTHPLRPLVLDRAATNATAPKPEPAENAVTPELHGTARSRAI